MRSVIFPLMLCLSLSNLVVMLLFQSGLAEPLYQWQYQAVNQAQQDLVQQVKATVDAVGSEDRAELEYQLQQNLSEWFQILPLEDSSLPEEEWPLLLQRDATGVLVSPLIGIGYVLLPQRYVVESDAAAGTFWLAAMVEWGLFAMLLAASVLSIVLVYLWHNSKHQRLVRQLLAKSEAEQEGVSQDIYLLANQLLDRQIHFKQEYSLQLERHKDLLHGIAHEFRSPLARIQFALDMMPENSDQQFLDLQHSINASVAELDALISELLRYAKLQHGGVSEVSEPVSLQAATQSSIDKVSGVYHPITFSNQIQAEVQVLGNSSLLERGLTNLLRNAGRYAVGRCEVSVLEEDEHWMIYIDDDGPGIPPGKRQRIFEPFTRLDPSRSRDSGGSGLGLAIVKSIVDLHQGEVSATESPLGGARFELRLPKG